ncbi:enoyl-CoA hydratase-related protein [Streptomyces sp. NPDC057376]|uniref:enoyl-CoA hydratase-related protein n=1 Tax=unclassified Streptomyces TaxID=2593676 RepID=UPI00093EEF84|nr:enoyl-CoA hydratase-related protein [Streptomyces sp. CB02414]OKI86222.1 enoyl-CoA hydratase [Streptomyces sp. CB02414]
MAEVELCVENGIATVLLNRPERLNAFTDAMEAGLISALDRADEDDDVRVVVLTGAGRAFCAGADLSAAGETFAQWRASGQAEPGTQFPGPGQELPVRRDGGGRVALRIFRCLKPVIAAVNGAAVGVGATMILACDIRMASEEARFGYVFGRIGVTPEACSSWFLPRVVPMQTALEWVLTARVFPAAEALDKGLVRSVHASGDLLPAAMALASEMADSTAPVSAALTRQMMWRMLTASDPMQAHYTETLALNQRGVSADATEGISAFLENRPPVFPDRVGKDLPDVFPHLETFAFEDEKLRGTDE